MIGRKMLRLIVVNSSSSRSSCGRSSSARSTTIMHPSSSSSMADGSESQLSWSLIRSMKVEPFVFLYMFTYAMSSMPINQLAQDKICRFRYHKDPWYCVDINSAENFNSAEKSHILADVSFFYLYRTMIATFPCVVWSMFIGSWSDKYIHGRKVLMCAGAIGAVLETVILIICTYSFESDVNLMLLASIPSAFSGGIIATLMAVYSYCSATSDTKSRAIRFAILEVSFWIPQPLGTFIGGRILGSGQKSSGQLYNYSTVFIISLVIQLLSLLWVIFMINENKSLRKSSSCLRFVQQPVFDPSNSQESTSFVEDSETSFLAHFKSLFDFANFREVISTCTKSRDNHARLEMWLLFVSIVCILLSYLGALLVLWSYVERLFSWTAQEYSNVNSVVSVISFIMMAVVVLVLVKKLKIRDPLLGIIGVVSLFGQNILRGSWQTTTGFYLSYVVGSLSSVTPIAIRSRLSKIIAPDEQGKVFSLMATIEALTPTLASIFYSYVFAATIDMYPGLVFQIAAVILFFPLLVLIWIDMYLLKSDA